MTRCQIPAIIWSPFIVSTQHGLGICQHIYLKNDKVEVNCFASLEIIAVKNCNRQAGRQAEKFFDTINGFLGVNLVPQYSLRSQGDKIKSNMIATGVSLLDNLAEISVHSSCFQLIKSIPKYLFCWLGQIRLDFHVVWTCVPQVKIQELNLSLTKNGRA